MREIKFRIRSERLKGHGIKWWYFWAHNGCGWKTSEEEEKTIGQFTGLKDKNGKEVFDGDVVKAHRFGFDGNETDIEFNGTIKYRPDGACFVISANDGDILVKDTTHFEEPCIEVIGNIYENPELLPNHKTER